MDTLAPAPRAATSQDSPLFRLARDLDARLRQRAVTRRRNFALDAFDLAECKRLELFRLLGYSSLTAYARAVNGFGSSKTSDLVRIAEACAELPRTRAAFLDGELDWCAAREIVKRATPADEEEWLEKASRLTVSELASVARDEDPVYRRLLELSGEELASVEAVVEAIRRECGPLAFGKALAEACRRMEAGQAGSLGGVGYRIVINRCGSCGETTRRTSQGAVPLRPQEVARIECDAEVLDIREGPAPISRTVPPKIHRHVMSRNDGRCLVPACPNPADAFHHELGWKNGHDPKTGFGLCRSHHDSRHRGFLRIEGAMPRARFYLADGTFLGWAGDAERAPEGVSLHEEGPAPARAVGEASSCEEGSAPATGEVSSCGERQPEGSPVTSSPPSVQQECAEVGEAAVHALKRLGLPATEARACVSRAVRQQPDALRDLGHAVAAALRELPSPA